MPIYEYECMSCGATTEAMQKFSDCPLTTCSECGGQLKKLISNTSFVLKGTGWYKTDYANRSGAPSPAPAKTESKVDSAKKADAETKKEPAPASK